MEKTQTYYLTEYIYEECSLAWRLDTTGFQEIVYAKGLFVSSKNPNIVDKDPVYVELNGVFDQEKLNQIKADLESKGTMVVILEPEKFSIAPFLAISVLRTLALLRESSN